MVPKWHLLELYLSIGLTLLLWFADADDAQDGPKLLVVVVVARVGSRL